MIQILIRGVDEFLGADVERVLLPGVKKLLNVQDDDVIFTCVHSIIYHNGVDQTSLHLVLDINLDTKYASKEQELAEFLLNETKQFSIHSHVQFNYLNGKSYHRIDETYPYYVTNSNAVEVEEDETEEDVEIFTGNIFEDFEEKIKNKKN